MNIVCFVIDIADINKILEALTFESIGPSICMRTSFTAGSINSLH